MPYLGTLFTQILTKGNSGKIRLSDFRFQFNVTSLKKSGKTNSFTPFNWSSGKHTDNSGFIRPSAYRGPIYNGNFTISFFLNLFLIYNFEALCACTAVLDQDQSICFSPATKIDIIIQRIFEILDFQLSYNLIGAELLG